MTHASFRPVVLCIGGTTRPDSSTEKALRHAARKVEALGGQPRLLASADLMLPSYTVASSQRAPGGQRLIEELRACHGLIVGSPGYHGNYSGLVKNVLDYAEDLAHDASPYLAGRAVGCIASAYGWQAIGTTLVGLRSVFHSLGAWNVPMGVSINSTQKIFDEHGVVVHEEVDREIDAMTRQVVEFARMRHAYMAAA